MATVLLYEYNIIWGTKIDIWSLQQEGEKGLLKADGDLGEFPPIEPNKIEIPHPLKYGSVGFPGLAETQNRNKNPNPCGL